MKYDLLRDRQTSAYFLGYYFPTRTWDRLTDEELEFTKNILKYKNYNGTLDRDVWADFTIELMSAIPEIVKEAPAWNREVHLVAVPRSSPDKHNAMVDSIQMIAKLSSDGASGCKIPIIDKSGMLVRNAPVRSSHMSSYYGERRPDIPEHIESLRLTESVIDRNVLYIIMDDIVTSGNTLWACLNKLLYEGVDKRNIRFLTIGRTI